MQDEWNCVQLLKYNNDFAISIGHRLEMEAHKDGDYFSSDRLQSKSNILRKILVKEQ